MYATSGSMLDAGTTPRLIRSRPVSYTYIPQYPHSVCTVM